MYIPDAIRATIELMQAPTDEVKVRTSYNLSAMSFTPSEIFAEIKKTFPNATINYKPDFRQEIAEGWSSSIDDSNARKDWNWNHEYDLSALTKDMIKNIRPKYA